MSPRRAVAVLVTVLALAVGMLVAPAGAHAADPPFVVVNSASYEPNVAPNSLATLFDSAGEPPFTTKPAEVGNPSNPPTTLAGVKVECLIRGVWQSQRLLYVSARQINLVTPEVTAGLYRLRVTRSNGSTTQNSVLLVPNAIGVFSAAATGQGPTSGRALYPAGDTYTTDPISNRRIPLVTPWGAGNEVTFRVTGGADANTYVNIRPTIKDVPTVPDQTIVSIGQASPGLQEITVRLNPATPVGDDLIVEINLQGSNTPTTVRTTISLTN